MNIIEKLMNIQSELKAPKGQRNSFGNYNYRSCEDILESIKPLLEKYKCAIVVGDTLYPIGERIFIQAKARLIDAEYNDTTQNYDEIDNNAYAELDKHKGMSLDQCTGTASSYARKYALNGLLAIDDTKDADTDEVTKIKKKSENKEIDKNKDNEFQVTEIQKITDTQAQALEMLLEKEQGRKEKMLVYFKVKTINDLSYEQYMKALEILSE